MQPYTEISFLATKRIRYSLLDVVLAPLPDSILFPSSTIVQLRTKARNPMSPSALTTVYGSWSGEPDKDTVGLSCHHSVAENQTGDLSFKAPS